MHFVKKPSLALSLVSACFIASAANANVITFGFTATVTQIQQVSSNQYYMVDIPSWTAVAGQEVFHDDKVAGQFFYDTDTPLSQSQFQYSAGIARSYDGSYGMAGLSFTNLHNRWSYQSSNVPRPDSHDTTTISVDDNTPIFGSNSGDQLDILTFEDPSIDPGRPFASVTFSDKTGQALSSANLPTTLPLSSFDSAVVSYCTFDVCVFSQFNTLQVISSVPSDVPEPSSPAIAALGLSVLAFASRWKRGT